MVAMREFCALLLAGGIGAGSTLAVQQAKPGVSRPKAAKVHKSADRGIKRSEISDCPSPMPAAQFAAVDLPVQPTDPIVPMEQTGLAHSVVQDGGLRLPALGGGGGGGGVGSGPSLFPAPPAPGVPAPDIWVMLVAGFGFVGMALRRPRAPKVANQGK